MFKVQCVDGSGLQELLNGFAALVVRQVVQHFVRVHRTAGHNARRGFRYIPKLAEDMPWHCGCPDRTEDRQDTIFISAYVLLALPNLSIRQLPARICIAPARWFLVSIRLWP